MIRKGEKADYYYYYFFFLEVYGKMKSNKCIVLKDLYGEKTAF